MRPKIHFTNVFRLLRARRKRWWRTNGAAAPSRGSSPTNSLRIATEFTSHVTIGGQLVQTFSLLLHELETNAAKYGALATQQGNVSVTWQIDRNDDTARLAFRWQEQGGPPVEPPTKKGFGSAARRCDPTSTSRLLFEPTGREDIAARAAVTELPRFARLTGI
jgi:hypothetical protein